MKEHNKENAENTSAISQHRQEFPDHKIDAMKAEIVDRADNNTKLLIKEQLHIGKQKPTLNTQHAAKYKNHEKGNLFNQQLNTIIIARKL